MKQLAYRSLVLAILMATISLVAAAQSEENKEPSPDNILVAQGAKAKISLQSRLHSKISEVGDEVTGVLYEPVRGADGRVAIPRGTEFIGRVTQVQAAKRPQKQATMTVVFEEMRMSYGTEKIVTIVTAIDDYANDSKMRSQDDEGKVGAGRSGERTARNAGIGGGLGTLGGIIGSAAGGGLGAIAGGIGGGVAGGVLVTKGNDIRLEAGTILRIRFERDLSLPANDGGR